MGFLFDDEDFGILGSTSKEVQDAIRSRQKIQREKELLQLQRDERSDCRNWK